MIKRFNPDFSLSISHELAYMRETPEGGYVAQGDYATLFSELEVAKAERDALAVENAAIKAMNDCLSEELRGYESDGAFEGPNMHLLWWKSETPATAAALSAIEARGVERFAVWAWEQESMANDSGDKKEARIYCQVEARAKHFANELREAK